VPERERPDSVQWARRITTEAEPNHVSVDTSRSRPAFPVA
jgi:hypothetical protein